MIWVYSGHENVFCKAWNQLWRLFPICTQMAKCSKVSEVGNLTHNPAKYKTPDDSADHSSSECQAKCVMFPAFGSRHPIWTKKRVMCILNKKSLDNFLQSAVNNRGFFQNKRFLFHILPRPSLMLSRLFSWSEWKSSVASSFFSFLSLLVLALSHCYSSQPTLWQ